MQQQMYILTGYPGCSCCADHLGTASDDVPSSSRVTWFFQAVCVVDTRGMMISPAFPAVAGGRTRKIWNDGRTGGSDGGTSGYRCRRAAVLRGRRAGRSGYGGLLRARRWTHDRFQTPVADLNVDLRVTSGKQPAKAFLLSLEGGG